LKLPGRWSWRFGLRTTHSRPSIRPPGSQRLRMSSSRARAARLTRAKSIRAMVPSSVTSPQRLPGRNRWSRPGAARRSRSRTAERLLLCVAVEPRPRPPGVALQPTHWVAVLGTHPPQPGKARDLRQDRKGLIALAGRPPQRVVHRCNVVVGDGGDDERADPRLDDALNEAAVLYEGRWLVLDLGMLREIAVRQRCDGRRLPVRLSLAGRVRPVRDFGEQCLGAPRPASARSPWRSSVGASGRACRGIARQRI